MISQSTALRACEVVDRVAQIQVGLRGREGYNEKKEVLGCSSQAKGGQQTVFGLQWLKSHFQIYDSTTPGSARSRLENTQDLYQNQARKSPQHWPYLMT